MDTTTLLVVTAIIILLIVVGVLGSRFNRERRTKLLQEQFGPEYDRILNEVGDQRTAEDELQHRVEHVKSLDIRPLSADQVAHFTDEWKLIQAAFVDEPLSAIQKANQLIKDAMRARGYPVDNFEQRAADISVDHPELVEDYRGLRMIAVTGGEDGELNTEDLRQAMVHVRALFEELVHPDDQTSDANPYEKERPNGRPKR